VVGLLPAKKPNPMLLQQFLDKTAAICRAELPPQLRQNYV